MHRPFPSPTLALPFLLLLACSEKDPEDEEETDGGSEDGGSTDGGSEDGGAECGSTQGFVYGKVTRVDSDELATDARVQAWDPTTGTAVDGELDGEGGYELNLEGGITWRLTAWERECTSETVDVPLEACEEVVLDLPLVDCDTADAPNLYLYPAVDTPTRVVLAGRPSQRVLVSDPPYRGSWKGIAHPDGTFTVGGQRAPFLFYEATLNAGDARAMQRDQGYCLPAGGSTADAAEAMAELMAAWGFDARERADFVEAWQATLPHSAEGYAVYPQEQVDFVVQVDISPALPLHRLWLLVEDGAGCVEGREPVVQPFDRTVPHAVEWGVVLHDLVR